MATIIQCGAYYLYKDGKSPFWQVRAEDAPRQPLFKSTKETNEANAKKTAKAIYADWAAVKDLKPGEQILFKDLWQEYVEEQATFVRPQTMTRMNSVYELHLKKSFGNRFIHEIQGLWPKFVRDQKKKRLGSTLFNERKYTLGALQYAYDHGYLDKIPPIATVEGVKHKMRVFTDSEIQKLLAACGTDRELVLNILFGFFMGLRHGEIAKLRVEDFDLADNTVHVRGTKTDRSDRVIALNSALIDSLKEQLAEVSPRSKFLFPQVNNNGQHKDQRVFDRAWQALKRDTGIEGRFHDLRHSCANRLKQSQVPVAVAAAYLGMSIRIYDQTYGKLGKDDTRPAAEVVRLPESRGLGRGDASKEAE